MVHILEDAIGPVFTIDPPSRPLRGWDWIAKTVAHEHGLREIPPAQTKFQRDRDSFADCLNYVMNADPDRALDVVELGMRVVDQALRKSNWNPPRRMSPDDAIADLNYRFRANGCGDQYANGQIIRVDSQLIHAEVVQPALALLMTKGFEGPNQEFLSAHEHFRHGRVEAAVTDACKAFESTIKAICDARNWTYDAKATAHPLIRIVIDHGLVPTYSQEQLENVAKCLIGLRRSATRTLAMAPDRSREMFQTTMPPMRCTLRQRTSSFWLSVTTRCRGELAGGAQRALIGSRLL